MLESLGAAVLFGGTGILLSAAGYRIFDLIETRIDFSDEIKKGNVAAGITVAGFLLGICFIVGRAVGGG